LEWFRKATKKAISRLDPKSAAGFDGIPAAYIKGACVQIQEGSKAVTKNVLSSRLAELFHLCYTKQVVPEGWKIARLTPLYKNKGPLLDPNSFRMLAVSSVFYRLFANIVRQVTTEWAVREGKVPETQFGFFPGRDTVQPAFILRHVVQAIRHAASQAATRDRRPNSRVYVAFMDFTQAYDTIDRKALWAHLESIAMPQHLLQAVKAMYENDTYILVDGGLSTVPIHPTRGVKQGCPLSPLLFSLYINDFEGQAPSLSRCGVPLREGSRIVSHMFYADDLVLMSCSEAGVNEMLGDLKAYADRKGLTVNAAKSEVMVFGSRPTLSQDGSTYSVKRTGRVPGNVKFRYGGAELSIKAQFKYLGMLFTSSLRLRSMQEPRAKGLLAAIGQLGGLGRDLGLQRSPWAMTKLFQSYAVSAGMYGSQLWGSRYVHMDKVFDSDVSRQHLRFIKRQLGVPTSTSSWAVLSEANCRPYHFYWVRAVCKFQARILNSNSPLLMDVAKADAALAAEGSGSCWSAEVGRALESICVRAGQADVGRAMCEKVFRGEQVQTTAVMASLEKAYEATAWAGFNDIPCVREHMQAHQGQVNTRSKAMVYHCWFKQFEGGWPEYLSGLPNKEIKDNMKHMARFRLSAHRLQVELGRREHQLWADRVCSRCVAGGHGRHVDDEQHMIFECSTFDDLRELDGVRDIIEETGDVRNFMIGDVSVVRGFISACMSRLDALAVQQ
jgi:hypothetical protein